MNKNTLSRRIITFTIIIFTSIILCAQTSFKQVKLDSLWNVWNDYSLPDTIRSQAMYEIARDGYIFSQPDSAFYFAQLEFDFAKSKGLKKQMAQALNIQGVSFYFQGDYARAIDHFTRSLTIKEEIGDKKGIAYSLNNIGMIYNEQGDYASTIDYYTRSLTINEEIGDKKGIALSLNNIGNIYREQSDYTSAIDYFTRSLSIKEEIGDKKGIANSYTNIGIIYKEQGDYDSAIDYFTRSLNINEEVGDKNGIANSLHYIGIIYKDQGDYASSIDYYTLSLTIKEELGDKAGIASSLNNIGIIYEKQGKYASAISYSKRSLAIAQGIGGAKKIESAAKALYDTYKANGRHKLSLEMYELYIATRDSINSEENQKEVIRQKFKYDYEKQAIADSVAYVQVQKVHEAKLEKSRIIQYSLIGGAVLLLVFLGYVFNRFRVTQKQKLLISEQNIELATATEIAKTVNTDLKIKSDELEKFNNTMLDREMRIIELKKEVNKLAKDNNPNLPYPEVRET